MRLGLSVAALLALSCHGPPAERLDGGAPDPSSDKAPAACPGAAGFAGCLFHFADTANDAADDGRYVSIFVANPGASEAPVTIEERTTGDWRGEDAARVPAGGAALIRLGENHGAPLDLHVDGDGFGRHLGLRLRSGVAVLAALWNSDALEADARSSSATLLVPTAALGTDYRAATVAPGLVALVGTRASTHVTIAPGAGAQRRFALDEGDVVQVRTGGEALTGASIVADAPIAVFTGSACTSVDPAAPPGVASDCDKIEEQILPTAAWGRTFVIALLPPRDEACAARQAGPWSTLVRVIAAEPDTNLVFDAAPGTGGVPPSDRLDAAGAWRQYDVDGGFLLVASRPVQVVAIVRCQAGLVVVPPLERWSDASLLLAPGLVRESAVVVRKVGAAVSLDGAPLLASSFVPVGGGFEAASLVLPGCGIHRFGPRPDGLGACVHRLSGEKAHATLTAADFLAGYALAGTYRIGR